MKPLIYLYQEQLQEFLNKKTNIVGAAYEWKGEGVYHAYFDYPKVAPTGFPLVCLFSFGKKIIETIINDFVSTNELQKKTNPIICIQFNIENDGIITKQGVVFNGNEFIEAEINYVPTKSELYTRSKGLLEVGVLEKKRVLIVGCGSGGSSIAVELAKAGVGNFVLVDFDRIELHNIARHISGVNELGRLKTNAVKDAILLKNPYAKITTYDFDMQQHLNIIEQEVSQADLVIPATDNNRTRNQLNEYLQKYKKTGIFGRANTRAEGGDVLRVRPEGPCYACMKGSGWGEELSDFKQARAVTPAYVSDEDVLANIQVGLSTDIAPINTMIVKLALLELSRGTECEINSLDAELTYDYYMWANRRDNHFKKWFPFNNMPNNEKPAFLQKVPTILQWYGVKYEKDLKCMVCSYG